MSERNEQMAFCHYMEMLGIYHFAIPNGGSRHPAEAVNLKKEGVKAGVPDIMIPIPRGKYHGLFIEMKYGKNKPTEKQKEWINLLNDLGYKAVVCYGFESAREVVDDYLTL